MAMFDVFVEGPARPSPDAIKRLVEVMSQRYRLPAAELATRLAKGRFRVKSNLDEATANKYARDLESIGARVAIVQRVGSQVSQNVVTRSPSTPPQNVAKPAQRPTPPPPELEIPDDLELAPPGGAVRPSAPRMSAPSQSPLRVPPPLMPPGRVGRDSGPPLDLSLEEDAGPRSPAFTTDRTPRSFAPQDTGARFQTDRTPRSFSASPNVSDSGARLPLGVDSPPLPASAAKDGRASSPALPLRDPSPALPPRDPSPALPPRDPAAPLRPSTSALPPRAATPPAGTPVSDAPARPSTSALPPRVATPPAGTPIRPSASALPPADAAPKKATPPSGLAAALPPADAAPKKATPPSGLAVAFSSDGDIGLGALEGEALSLAPLDDDAKPAITFTPPTRTPTLDLPAPSAVSPKSKAGRSRDMPVDLFTPPGAGEAELSLEIAADDFDPLKHNKGAKQAPAAPPPPEPTPAAAITTGKQTPMLQRKAVPTPQVPQGVVVESPPRWQFAAVVAAAFLLGLFVSQTYVSTRDDVLDEIDEQVALVQAQADRPDAQVPYAKLDEFRDARRSAKQAAQEHTALVAFGVWALVAAIVTGAWFGFQFWRRRRG